MQVKDAHTFTSLLNIVSTTPNTYLAQTKDSSFKIVRDRADKNLNTETITQIAEACLQVDPETKKLRPALTAYLDRVHRCMPWYLRLAAFFGWKSSAVRRIEAILQKCPLAKTANIHKPQKFSDRYEVVLFYHKVLDSKKKREDLDGCIFKYSIASIADDLIRYQAQAPYLNQDIIDLIEELHEALVLTRSLEELIQSIVGQGKKVDFAAQIIEKMKELPPKSEGSRHAVLIPAGSVKHAILCVVERALDDTFSFTVVNTGLGGRKAPFEIEESGICHAPNQEAVIDIKYSSLTGQELSYDFFTKLLTLRTSSMESVNNFIETSLAKPDLSNVRIARSHKAQKNGTCSMKCLLAYIRDRLGENEYRKFKVYMTMSAIKRFEQSCSYLTDKEQAELRKEAAEVLAKRKSKASNIV